MNNTAHEMLRSARALSHRSSSLAEFADRMGGASLLSKSTMQYQRLVSKKREDKKILDVIYNACL